MISEIAKRTTNKNRERTGRAAQRLPSTAPTWVMMVTNDIRRLNSNFY